MRYDSTINFPSDIGERIEQSLLALEAELDVSITIIDYGFIFHVSKAIYGGDRQSHKTSDVCRLGFCARCIQHCRDEMNRRGEREGAPFVHRCWKSLYEVVVPLTWDKRHIGNLFAGTWRAPDETEPPTTPPLPQEMVDLYWQLPVLDEAHMARVGQALWLTARGVAADLAELLALTNMPTTRHSIIHNYVHYAISHDVTLDDLAGALNLSRSRTSHLVKEECGQSFQYLVRKARMKRARDLLVMSDHPISEISKAVGINSLSHFSRLFKSEIGQSPLAYRHNNARKAKRS